MDVGSCWAFSGFGTGCARPRDGIAARGRRPQKGVNPAWEHGVHSEENGSEVMTRGESPQIHGGSLRGGSYGILTCADSLRS